MRPLPMERSALRAQHRDDHRPAQHEADQQNNAASPNRYSSLQVRNAASGSPNRPAFMFFEYLLGRKLVPGFMWSTSILTTNVRVDGPVETRIEVSDVTDAAHVMVGVVIV